MVLSDFTAGNYIKKYPIASIAKDIDGVQGNHSLVSRLQNCLWYKHGSNTLKSRAVDRLKAVLLLQSDIQSLLIEACPSIKIKSISIAGSYLFKENPVNDIDFDVVVEGSYFSYVDIFNIDAINNKLPKPVRKVSFMIFGEVDFLKDTGINDCIETPDFLHTSLCVREGLVLPIRNVIVYGTNFVHVPVDKYNMLIRIKRQLYHAEMMLEGRVDLHRTEQARCMKAIGRIAEAYVLVAEFFKCNTMSVQSVLAKEEVLLRESSELVAKRWLADIRVIVDSIKI